MRGGRLVGLALLAVLAHLPVLWGGFEYDDRAIVEEGAAVNRLALTELFTTNYWGELREGGLYRPLVLLTFAVERRFARLSSGWMHLTNLLLHALVVVLGGCWLRRLGIPDRPATVAMALFAVHPVHTETVGLLVGRADLLVACFGLGYLLLHRRGTVAGQLAAALCLSAALLSKESAAVLPALAWLTDRSEAPPRARTGYLLYLVVLGAWVGLRLAVLGRFGPPAGASPLAGLSLASRLGLVPLLYGAYLRLLAFPVDLSVDYQYLQSDLIGLAGAPFGHPLFLLGGVALILTGWLWVRRPEAPAWRLGAAWLLLALIPVLQLVPVGMVLAERVLYLPSLGFVLMMGLAYERVATGWGRPGALIVLLLCLCTLSLARSQVLSDPLQLWTRTTERHPSSHKAWHNLGTLQLERGQPEAAARAYEKALTLQPDKVEGSLNLARYHLAHGSPGEAVRAARRVLTRQPGRVEASLILAEAHLRQGETAAAWEALARLEGRPLSRPQAQWWRRLMRALDGADAPP